MKILLATIALTGLLAAVAPAHAVSGINQLKNNLGIIGTETGLGTQGDASLPEKIAAIVNIALGFVALIGVIMIIYAGFRWMTASGNEEQVTEAKGNIRNAVIGIVIILIAFVIVNFTVNQLSDTVGVGEGGSGTVIREGVSSDNDFFSCGYIGTCGYDAYYSSSQPASVFINDCQTYPYGADGNISCPNPSNDQEGIIFYHGTSCTRGNERGNFAPAAPCP